MASGVLQTARGRRAVVVPTLASPPTRC